MRLNLIFSELIMDILLGWRNILEKLLLQLIFQNSILFVLVIFIRSFKVLSETNIIVL